MRALLRIILLIPVAYCAACLAAAAILSASSLRGGQDIPPEFTPAIAVFAAFTGPIVGAAIFVPSLIAIVLAEMFKWHSLYGYLIFGALLALAGQAVGLGAHSASGGPALEARLAAGLVGAAVYWMIAGRRAGC